MNDNFSIVISNTERSIYYLRELEDNNFFPKNIIYLDDLIANKISKFIKKKITFFNSSTLKIFNQKIIDRRVANFLINTKPKNIIYSGYPGIIIKQKKLLNNKNLIHAHPGKLPEYKGSTTIYYSLLREKKIYCSTIILNEKIDSGKILMNREYPLLKNMKLIDKDYDNFIRSKNIILFLKNMKKKYFKRNLSSLPYYVIHPILRSIVLNYKK